MAEKAEVKGTKWLAEYINEELGTSYTSYQLRILLRKLVKDEVIDREEGQYSFKGERDPRVRAVLKAVKAGAMEQEKKARISKARTKKDEDVEEEAKPARRSRAKKAPVEDDEPAPKPARKPRAKKAAPVEEPDEDDIDLDEL